MNKKLIFGFVASLIVLMCLLCTFLTNFREEHARSTFAQQICDNLIQADYLRKSDCMISNSVPEVIKKNFPEGKDIDYVLAGMKGFEKIMDTTSKIPDCETYRVIRFVIIPGQFFSWDENVVFSFCNRILFNISWEN